MNRPIMMVSGILLGATVGAVTVVLSAPHSGKETRDVLKKRSQHLRKRLSRKAKQLVDEATA